MCHSSVSRASQGRLLPLVWGKRKEHTLSSEQIEELGGLGLSVDRSVFPSERFMERWGRAVPVLPARTAATKAWTRVLTGQRRACGPSRATCFPGLSQALLPPSVLAQTFASLAGEKLCQNSAFILAASSVLSVSTHPVSMRHLG